MNRDPDAHIKFAEPMWDTVSHHCKNCIRKMMIGDPLERPSIFEVLKEPWLLDENENSVSTDLHTSQRQLRGFLARRRLKKGITAVMAMTRLRRMSSITPRMAKRSVEEAAEAARRASLIAAQS